MRLRKFTPEGMDWFREFRSSRVDESSALRAILKDRRFAAYAEPEVAVDRQDFATRFTVGKYFHDLLHPKDSTPNILDVESWTWLCALHFDLLCPLGATPGDRARWEPAVGNFRQYYRHLLAGPYLIYRAHYDKPTRAMALLTNEPRQPGEIAEQLASRQELVTNPTVIEVATRLYVNPTTKRPKRHAAGKGPGSARRLVAVLSQFDLIWDLWCLSPEQLLELLPNEFDPFRL